MKKQFITVAVMLVLFTVALSAQTGTVKISPEKPAPGSEIIVNYTPEAGTMKGASVYMRLFTYSKDKVAADEVILKSENGKMTGSIRIPSEAMAAVLVFTDLNESDNNKGEGYTVGLYTADGKVLPGSRASLAEFLRGYGYMADLEFKNSVIYDLYKSEFRDNPGLKLNYYPMYARLLRRVESENYKNLIMEDLLPVISKMEKTEADLELIVRSLPQGLNDSLIKVSESELLTKYPKNSYSVEKEISSINGEKDLQKRLEMINNFAQKNPDNENLSNLSASLIGAAVRNKEYEKIDGILENLSVKPTVFIYYRIADRYYQDKKDSAGALAWAEKGIKYSDILLADLNKTRPVSSTPSMYKASVLNERAMVLGLKADYLKMMNKSSDALTVIEEVYSISQEKDYDLINKYVELLIKNGDSQKAFSVIMENAPMGYANEYTYDMFRAVYSKVKGNSDNLDNTITLLKTQAHDYKLAKFKKRLVNYKAPDFELYDLDGRLVKLSDYRGKYVIVDFWATWCGPCLASFPGMQKAIERFNGNNEVVFLFLNTWENKEDKKQNATDFIAKNNYPFHVLLDDKDKIVTQFEVSGIPTKFFLDKNGNVRLKEVGFSGDTEGMPDEIEMIINLLKENL